MHIQLPAGWLVPALYVYRKARTATTGGHRIPAEHSNDMPGAIAFTSGLEGG